MADEVKQKLLVAGLTGFDGRMAAEGGGAEYENPDDAAAENNVVGVAVA